MYINSKKEEIAIAILFAVVIFGLIYFSMMKSDKLEEEIKNLPRTKIESVDVEFISRKTTAIGIDKHIYVVNRFHGKHSRRKVRSCLTNGAVYVAKDGLICKSRISGLYKKYDFRKES